MHRPTTHHWAVVMSALAVTVSFAGCWRVDRFEISYAKDGSCYVNGERIEPKQLGRHLRAMQADNPRLDLKRAVILLPWNGTDEQCTKLEAQTKRVLRGLGLGAKVDCRRADNPFVAFGRAMIPYLLFAGIIAVVVVVVKKRAAKNAARRALRQQRRTT